MSLQTTLLPAAAPRRGLPCIRPSSPSGKERSPLQLDLALSFVGVLIIAILERRRGRPAQMGLAGA